MSIELKVEVFKQRIGELVSAYENKVVDLKIANTYLTEEKARLDGRVTELENQVNELEERLNTYVAKPQEEPGENYPENEFPVLDCSSD